MVILCCSCVNTSHCVLESVKNISSNLKHVKTVSHCVQLCITLSQEYLKDYLTRDDFQEVISEISLKTGLGVSLDGIYRWIVFLPSRMDQCIPVASRYFGVFQDGSITVRGIEARRRDTPPWIVETQSMMLEALSRPINVNDLPKYVAIAVNIFRTALKDIQTGKVPLEKLVVTSRISHELEAYRSPTPAVRAATLLFKETGKRLRPGQKMRFIYTRDSPDVHPWESPKKVGLDRMDREKYITLLVRAASNVLQPFGITEDQLKQWAQTATIKLEFNFRPSKNHVRRICH